MIIFYYTSEDDIQRQLKYTERSEQRFANANNLAGFGTHAIIQVKGDPFAWVDKWKGNQISIVKLKLKYSCWYLANRYVCSNGMRFARETEKFCDFRKSAKQVCVGLRGAIKLALQCA